MIKILKSFPQFTDLVQQRPTLFIPEIAWQHKKSKLLPEIIACTPKYGNIAFTVAKRTKIETLFYGLGSLLLRLIRDPKLEKRVRVSFRGE